MRASRRISQSEYAKRFGQIAVEQGFVTPPQMKAALMEQVEDDLAGRPHRNLGTIFFEKQWMTWKQIDAVLDLMFGIPKNRLPAIVIPGRKPRR